VIGVQVGQEDLVEVLIGDHQCGQVRHRAAADVENELVAVACLNEETGGCLTAARGRHAGAAGCDPNLVLGKHLRARVIDVAIRCNFIRAGDDAAGSVGFTDERQLLDAVVAEVDSERYAHDQGSRDNRSCWYESHDSQLL
jgi:hypothetical protein